MKRIQLRRQEQRSGIKPVLPPARHKVKIKPRSLYLLSSILVFFITVCISAWVLAQQPVTLRLLIPAPDAPTHAGLIKAFEQQNPNIRIELVEGPNASNLVEDLYTSAFLLGDSPYDLALMDIVWTPKFAAAGWLDDLTDKVTPEQLSIYSEGALAGGRYNGKLYRLPLRSDAGLLFYRQDLLDQAGLKPPETFDELLQTAKTVQEKLNIPWGYLWQGRQYEGAVAMFVEVLQGYGGFWVNPQTREVGLDRPETIQAVNFLKATIQRGISPPGVTTYIEEDTRRIFQSGHAVFLRSWPYVWPAANQDNSPIKGKIGLKPMPHQPGHEGGGCLGGWGLGISKTTPHPQEAWKAVQFLTSQAPQKEFILETGYMPTIEKVFTDPDVAAKYSYLPQLLQVDKTAVLRPPIAQYSQASDILQRYLSAALTDRLSPETAMQRAAAETRRLLGT
jgi:multiple sugar transport system substrate-binding protein